MVCDTPLYVSGVCFIFIIYVYSTFILLAFRQFQDYVVYKVDFLSLLGFPSSLIIKSYIRLPAQLII